MIVSKELAYVGCSQARLVPDGEGVLVGRMYAGGVPCAVRLGIDDAGSWLGVTLGGSAIPCPSADEVARRMRKAMELWDESECALAVSADALDGEVRLSGRWFDVVPDARMVDEVLGQARAFVERHAAELLEAGDEGRSGRDLWDLGRRAMEGEDLPFD